MIKNSKHIADCHQQFHIGSCATSLGELLLKLEGEIAPDLQQYEAGGASTGLAHLKDKTYGRITIRQFLGGKPLSTFVADEINAGRAVGIFLKNTFWHASVPGIHAWAAVALVDNGGMTHVRMLAKYSELGQEEGKITAEQLPLLTALDTAPVTDVVHYVVAPQVVAGP